MHQLKVKKGDIVIIGLLILISFVPYVWIANDTSHDIKGTYAYITVAGEKYAEIPLTGQSDCKEIIIQTEYGRNIIKVEDEGISVMDSDCHDHLCETFGVKKQVGDVIVCLPHQLYIEIKGNSYYAT